MSVVTSTSLMASGTPAMGLSSSPAARRRSMSAATSSAWSLTWRNAWMPASTAAMRSRWACVASTLDTSRAASLSASAAALRVMRSVTDSPLLLFAEDRGHAEPAVRGVRCVLQHLRRRQLAARDIRAEHVLEGDRVARRGNVGRGDLGHLGDVVDDDVELA